MAKENLQNPIKSAIWPVACLGLILFFGIRYHASVLAWLVTGIVWTTGAIVEIIQYGKDEETLFPAWITFIAIAIMALWMLA